MKKRSIQILGIRGIPASHGGFETFAEALALDLVKKGWSVTVYCQEKGGGEVSESFWRGIRRIHIPVSSEGAKGTVQFDWRATRIASSNEGLKLVLGYNTALFNGLLRLAGRTHLINMDGLEWKRNKWGLLERIWLWFNERLGCWFGNHLIADHPQIARHLESRVRTDKITMIPYGSYCIEEASEDPLRSMGLVPMGYSILIARPEPENSILEIIRAFSTKPRRHKMVVLGKYMPDVNDYHRLVIEAASSEIIFPGAIYDTDIVGALRFHCRLYVHGHTVGGTNPSLVEALGAGSAVLAHDNPFNRWVAGPHAGYFANEEECVRKFDELLANDDRVKSMKEASRARHAEEFTWDSVLEKYELLALRYVK